MSSVNLITLGCSKNLVDSEHLLARFRASGFEVMHNDFENKADIVILNTCGFILDAKEESVDTILAYLEEKKRGNLKKLYVMGCLSERYRDELELELPGVDGYFGVWDFPAILDAVGSPRQEQKKTARFLSTPPHYAYLKISEGCNRTCSFCAIPGIRGRQQSIPVETLMEEARNLVRGGVKELILIAQDLSSYGTDLNRKKLLPQLLKELVSLEGLEWIRLQYAYPTGFPEEVIDLMASEKKICRYLDIPIQHIHDDILSAMGRGHTRAKLEELLRKFREKVPGVHLRTTVLTGFPGETREHFDALTEFISEFRFDRLGVFAYSHEENTPAYRQFRESLTDREKQERAARIMEIQQDIAFQLNQEKVGQSMKVLIDRMEGDYYVGRTEFDSPDVDNEVLLSRSEELEVGTFYDVFIESAEEFDLYGRLVR
ncbi:MAG: 30S ribosomal protein S12 methylthiotransferase RimO [Bacteroidales bacterium]